MGRAPSQWNGRITEVRWSPWFGHRVPSLTAEVLPARGTPEGQQGRLIHCALTPAKARKLAAALLWYADNAETEPIEEN